jgi:hypothetical protein
MQHTDAYWKMRRKLAKGLGDQIDEIQAEKKSSKTEVNAEIIKRFQALRQKTDEILEKLNDLKDASESTRENFKEEMEKELDNLKAAVDEAISRFK